MSKAAIFVPCYFGSIDQWIAIFKYDEILFEAAEHYQKQSFRNRQEIYSSNAKLKLSIPIKHVPGRKNTHQVLRDVKIENEFNWQKEHFKSLQIAYQTTPFFEFFEDEIQSLYQSKYTYLIDFNLACFHVLRDLIDLPISYETTNSYIADSNHYKDYRYLANAKRAYDCPLDQYNQVFMEKHGFIKNLSILDLIFNLGNETTAYLNRHAKKQFEHL